MHRPSLRVAVAAAALVLTVAAPASAQLPDPAGNDGTIKIDDLPLDDLLDNEPHVGCNFQVDFYGYAQADDLTAQVTFEALAPTGGGEILTEEVDLQAHLAADLDPGVVGEVPVGAGVALNASATFDLWAAGLADIEPHPEQGWHVKLTVHVDGGSIGADVKAKVFWVRDCGTPGSTTTTTEPPVTTSTTTPEGPDNGTTTTTLSPPDSGSGSGPSDDSSSEPSDADEAATQSDSDGDDGGLPITGSNTLPLLGAGLGLLGVGGATLYGVRRLRAG